MRRCGEEAVDKDSQLEYSCANAMSDSEIVLCTKHLSKSFGTNRAVDDLSIEIPRGEVFGFLGPNGAGKTTTIGMILGLIRPTAGEVEVFGLNVKNHLAKILPRIGVVMETPCFYPYLSGWDNLEVLGQVRGGVGRDRIRHVLDMMDLRSRSQDKFQTYSSGMKQRLAVACALLNDPELLIFDEPTNGLDPAGMKEMREFITGLAGEGRTVFLSSHLLHEVEQVCHQVAIIKRGRLIACGGVSELLKRGRMLQLRVTDRDKAIRLLSEVDWISSVAMEGDLMLVDAPSERAAEVSAILAKSDVFVYEIMAREETLEDFFLEVTGE